MNKVLICKECNMRFISANIVDTCPSCISKSKENDDGFVVAPINIMKMVSAIELITSKRMLINSLKELDFVLSHAYARGYISEDFYEDICEEVGLIPTYNEPKSLYEDDMYDYSVSAREGYYYDMCSIQEE